MSAILAKRGLTTGAACACSKRYARCPVEPPRPAGDGPISGRRDRTAPLPRSGSGSAGRTAGCGS
jgi:hypothetical protein